MVLVDTSVWSLALRRGHQSVHSEKLSELITAAMVVLIGPIRQELLSGIPNQAVFNALKLRLEPFDDLPLTTHDHETAAGYFNTCRSHGIQGSHTDFLICAVAHNNDLQIFTTDQDFTHYATHLPIRLFKIS